jgi:hypothetical protein
MKCSRDTTRQFEWQQTKQFMYQHDITLFYIDFLYNTNNMAGPGAPYLRNITKSWCMKSRPNDPENPNSRLF